MTDELNLSTPHGRRALENAAILAHEANRYYCQAMGDMTQRPWLDADDHQQKSCLDGVENLIQNPSTTPAQSHANWTKTKLADGWVYGPKKDPEKKTHPCLVPYENLPAAQQIKDAIFGAVVREALHCYSKRVMVNEPATLAACKVAFSAQDPDKLHGLILQIDRINRICYQATVAYLGATNYPVPREISMNLPHNAEFHHMVLFAISAKDPEQAYDWYRTNKWPELLPDFPGPNNNGAPAAYHQLERLRVMWHLVFGVTQALMWIEGIEFRPLSRVTTRTWSYVRPNRNGDAWSDGEEQVINIETKMAIAEELEVTASRR